MTHLFEHQMQGLTEKLLTMGSQAESALARAVQAVVERNDDLARRVEQEDSRLDQLEVEVDETCIQLLAQAPLASDLRLITVAMKISQNLERVGDEATKITRRATELNQEPPLKPYVDIPRMADMALRMLKDALDSFVHRDPDRARAVIPRDKEVDLLNKQLQRELVGFVIEQPANIARCLSLMVISKSIERVADHAKNIAEEVVYLYEARDIRHAAQLAPPAA